MRKIRIYGLLCCLFVGVTAENQLITTEGFDSMQTISNHNVKAKNSVIKKKLSNGMTILVRVVRTIPKVSIQLWYDVGSRDEQDQERGIAHLIEHMIFKGTETMLSESDINILTHKLSGYTNAFTSYDYTGYLFNFPTEHWHTSFPVMADCMQNCRFDEQMLNSEMKAVIQELKMYRDKYLRALVDEIMGAIFADHPYHHPIIGYKQDLWGVTAHDLKQFYKKHYHPGNATLVVVGDVDPQEVFQEAERYFGAIPAVEDHKRQEAYFTRDIVSKSVTLYRDVQQPAVIFAFVVPGIESKKDSIMNILAWLLGKGKSSRLYRILVDELQLVTSLTVESEELYQHGLFLISFEPKSVDLVTQIKEVIHREIADLIANGPTEHEMNRAIKQTRMEIYELLEDIEQQAYEIGKYYQATGDENYLFHYLDKSYENIKQEMHDILKNCMRQTVMHEGYLLPLPEAEKDVWTALQLESDILDQKILEKRERTTAIEQERYAATIEPQKSAPFSYPKPEVYTLANGLTVLLYRNENIPKVDMTLHFKARSYYDPENKQGLYRFMTQMLMEGTEHYSAQEFADLVESRGISLNVYPGGISINLLADDGDFGLRLIHELVHYASFDSDELEKVRAQLLTRVKRFWDEPSQFSNQLIQEMIYVNHPYHKNSLGTIESLLSITRDDLIAAYKHYIVPHDAVLAIVGDFDPATMRQQVETILGSWRGHVSEKPLFPVLKKTEDAVVNYPMNRDQIVLTFAALSVDRMHPDYDKLLIFNQIFGGGSLGSMHSRLFQLREQSGLFYTINGSLTAGSDEQPGLFMVRTIVSLDRLAEAEKAILEVIKNVAYSITQEECEEAKRAVLSAQIDFFESNESIASAFLFLKRYGFDWSFFDTRAEQLEKITLQEVKDAAHRIMTQTGLITLRVGRV